MRLPQMLEYPFCQEEPAKEPSQETAAVAKIIPGKLLSGDDFCALQPGFRGGGAEEQGQGQQIGAAAGVEAPGHQMIVQGLQRRGQGLLLVVAAAPPPSRT